jgi:O-antigen ligase
MSNSKINLKKDPYSGSIWALITGLAAITLYFNQNFEDPFNTPKLVLLLITAGWLSGHILNYYKKSKISVNSSEFWLLILISIFIISQIFALLFTEIFIVGFVGDTQRRNGFLGYFALTLILLFTSIRVNIFYSLRLIKSSVFIALVLSFYGLLQLSGRDFVKWDNPYNSMISTLGNPNFASALLAILTIMLTLLLFIKCIPNIYKILSVLVIVSSMTAIIRSDSRQGLLVIVFGLMFYLVVYTSFHYKRIRSIVALTTIACFGLITFGMLQIGPLSSYLYKSSVTVRGYYWRAAIDMFRSNPWTGIGLDSYGSYFKEFRDVGYPLKYGFEITSSNAHNVYLQLFSTGGLFVGLSYVTILLFVFFIGLKHIKYSSGDEQKIALLLLSAWVGFQAQSLISIDNIGVSVWGWILSGVIIGNSNNSQRSNISANISRKSLKAEKPVNLFQSLASIFVLVPTMLVSINLWNTESQMRLVRQYASSTNVEVQSLADKNAKKLFSNKFADPTYKFKAALYLVDIGYIDESYKQIMVLHRNDPRNLDLLRWLSEYSKSKSDYKNEVLYRTNISLLDPWNADNYFLLGIAYKQIGELDTAKNMFEKIIEFAPKSEVAKIAATEL